MTATAVTLFIIITTSLYEPPPAGQLLISIDRALVVEDEANVKKAKVQELQKAKSLINNRGATWKSGGVDTLRASKEGNQITSFSYMKNGKWAAYAPEMIMKEDPSKFALARKALKAKYGHYLLFSSELPM